MSWLDRLKALDADVCVRSRPCQNRQNPGSVSFVGASEAHIPSPQGASDDEDAREAWEERAAIMEYDGGMTRAEAERAATECLRRDASKRTLPAELDWGDLRPCTWCRNLTRSGRCLAAWRGELRAARDYEPTFPGQPHRCIGYQPTDADPDQTRGLQRWPELAEWQARLREGA